MHSLVFLHLVQIYNIGHATHDGLAVTVTPHPMSYHCSQVTTGCEWMKSHCDMRHFSKLSYEIEYLR